MAGLEYGIITMGIVLGHWRKVSLSLVCLFQVLRLLEGTETDV